jgi:hypothetical protein
LVLLELQPANPHVKLAHHHDAAITARQSNGQVHISDVPSSKPLVGRPKKTPIPKHGLL